MTDPVEVTMGHPAMMRIRTRTRMTFLDLPIRGRYKNWVWAPVPTVPQLMWSVWLVPKAMLAPIATA